MADGSAIEWTEATWNPATGCSHVSDGCTNCYAETLTERFAGQPGWIEEHRPWTKPNAAHNVRLHPERLDQPLRWRRPRMIFVNSMSDLFHEEIPAEFIFEAFTVMALARQHTFQVLTKRPERARELLASDGAHDELERLAVEYADQSKALGLTRARAVYRSASGWRAHFEWPLPNCWLGVSIESARHNDRADILREIPAAVRFLSCEPLLGSLFYRGDTQAEREAIYERYGSAVGIRRDLNVNCGRAPLDLTGISWVIVGGESGPGARPMQYAWAEELVEACLMHDPPVAVFVKQLGKVLGRDYGAGSKGGDFDRFPLSLQYRQMPEAILAAR